MPGEEVVDGEEGGGGKTLLLSQRRTKEVQVQQAQLLFCDAFGRNCHTGPTSLTPTDVCVNMTKYEGLLGGLKLNTLRT